MAPALLGHGVAPAWHRPHTQGCPGNHLPFVTAAPAGHALTRQTSKTDKVTNIQTLEDRDQGMRMRKTDYYFPPFLFWIVCHAFAVK